MGNDTEAKGAVLQDDTFAGFTRILEAEGIEVGVFLIPDPCSIESKPDTPSIRIRFPGGEFEHLSAFTMARLRGRLAARYKRPGSCYQPEWWIGKSRLKAYLVEAGMRTRLVWCRDAVAVVREDEATRPD